jgi:hypothetical protein
VISNFNKWLRLYEQTTNKQTQYTIDSRPEHIYRIASGGGWQFQKKDAKDKTIWHWVENKESVAALNKKYKQTFKAHEKAKLPLESESDEANFNMAKHYIEKNSSQRKEVINAIKKAGKSLGLSNNAIAALLGNVGRENGFRWEAIATPHLDPKNSKTNFGIISWQGARRDKLLKNLEEAGAYKEGKIVGTVDTTILEMMKFIKEEMDAATFSKLQSNLSTKEAADIFYKYIVYSMGKYNRPDDYFHAWKNHMWAKAAKDSGLVDYSYA